MHALRFASTQSSSHPIAASRSAFTRVSRVSFTAWPFFARVSTFPAHLRPLLNHREAGALSTRERRAYSMAPLPGEKKEKGPRGKRRRAASDNGDEGPAKPRKTPNTTPNKGKKRRAATDDGDHSSKEPPPSPKATARKGGRKPAPPVADRTAHTKLRVGAHVSSAGGAHYAVTNARYIGANAFAFHLKSQRRWNNPPLDPKHALSFFTGCKEHEYVSSSDVVPHGSYLVNLAHPDADRTKQAYECFLDDVTRCARLGIGLYNFHPGNVANTTREEGIAHVAVSINRAHADRNTGSVVILLETMAGGGNVLGSTFKDLAAMIALTKDKSRIGVCLDTAHVFAAGYDIRTQASLATTLAAFDGIIGLRYLKALHVNDSKAPFGSHRDLHARIGTGFLGLSAFHALVNEPRLQGLPMVLETPAEVEDEKGKKVEDKRIWAREIKLLEALVGMNMEGDEFRGLSAELQKQGTSERERVQAQVDKKLAKNEKGKTRGNKDNEKISQAIPKYAGVEGEEETACEAHEKIGTDNEANDPGEDIAKKADVTQGVEEE